MDTKNTVLPPNPLGIKYFLLVFFNFHFLFWQNPLAILVYSCPLIPADKPVPADLCHPQ